MQESMTILITTHSMEEADALCSRIAIMTKKGLQCIGDQIHLKNKYGKGFLLSIALNDSISDVCGYVKTHICPQAEFLEVKLNIHTFTILKEKVDLSNLILQIMKLQKDKIVTYWSVNESSLSDVFERICKTDEQWIVFQTMWRKQDRNHRNSSILVVVQCTSSSPADYFHYSVVWSRHGPPTPSKSVGEISRCSPPFLTNRVHKG